MFKGYSVNIGVNKVGAAFYGDEEASMSFLHSCERDAKALADLAMKQGFEKPYLLLTKDATISNLTNTLFKISHKIKPGDFLFLSYSGHGAKVLDMSGDEEDGKDEVLCLYDGPFPDDYLTWMLSTQFSGVRIFLLFNSCYAGSMIDNASVLNWQSVSWLQVFASSTGDRKSKAGNRSFTQQLLKVWNSGSFNGTYEDLFYKTEEILPADQFPEYLHYNFYENSTTNKSKPFQI